MGGGTTVSSPTRSRTASPTPSSNSKFYNSMDWKEKFEETEKRRLHLVTLAQKGTENTDSFYILQNMLRVYSMRVLRTDVACDLRHFQTYLTQPCLI
jgi:hypothetical protein